MSDFQNLQGKRVIAYRQGSFDAFIAAFIYWTFFRDSLKQVYYAVDPFSNAFLSSITETNFPEFVVSIGTNIRNLRSLGHVGDHGLPVGLNKMSLYAFENSPTFEPTESMAESGPSLDGKPTGLTHCFFYDTKLTLANNVFKTLSEQGLVDVNSKPYRMLVQGLRLDEANHYQFIPGSLLYKLAGLFPLMRPEDFPQLYELMFEPTNYITRFSKKSIDDIRKEEYQQLVQSTLQTGIESQIGGFPFAIFNTTNFSHPLFAWDTFKLNKRIPAFIYTITPAGVRGKLFMPSGYTHATATSFFPATAGFQFCGNDSAADALLPHSVLNILLSSK